MPASLFVFYSRTDADYVQRLAAHLRSRGLDPWFDRDIANSDQRWQSIVERMRSCDAVVLVMSPELERSDWVVKEVLLARRETSRSSRCCCVGTACRW